jgi:uncharacterized membrane protein YqiK
MADIQNQMVKSEQGVRISELEAAQVVKKAVGDAESVKLRAMGEAEAVRQVGQAQAEAYKVGVQSLGEGNYTMIQLMQAIGEKNIRITPDVLVSSNEKGGTLLDVLLGQMVKSKSGPGAPSAGPIAGKTGN